MWTGATDDVSKLIDKYQSVFTRQLGTVKSCEASLEVRPNTKPNFSRARGVPFALQPRIEQELNRLVEVGILEKVQKSERASPIVAVPKRDETLRIIAGILRERLIHSFVLINTPPKSRTLFSSHRW